MLVLSVNYILQEADAVQFSDTHSDLYARAGWSNSVIGDVQLYCLFTPLLLLRET